MKTITIEINLIKGISNITGRSFKDIYVNGIYIGAITKITRKSRSFYEGAIGEFHFNDHEDGLIRIGAEGFYKSNYKTIKQLKEAITMNFNLNHNK